MRGLFCLSLPRMKHLAFSISLFYPFLISPSRRTMPVKVDSRPGVCYHSNALCSCSGMSGSRNQTTSNHSSNAVRTAGSSLEQQEVRIFRRTCGDSRREASCQAQQPSRTRVFKSLCRHTRAGQIARYQHGSQWQPDRVAKINVFSIRLRKRWQH